MKKLVVFLTKAGPSVTLGIVLVTFILIVVLEGCSSRIYTAEEISARRAAHDAQAIINQTRLQAWMETCKASEFDRYEFVQVGGSTVALKMYCKDGTDATFF